MGIEVSNEEVQPALVFNRIFVQNLQIIQLPIYTEMEMPKYTVCITYVKYAIDTDGNRYYKTKSDSVQLKDYAGAAVQAMLTNGDTRLYDSMIAIEGAIAAILEKETELGTTSII